MRKKNMAALLKERLPRKIIQLFKKFGLVADMLEYNVYLVGGLVRDILLKRENLDVDIVVEGDGIHFAHEFAKHYESRVRSHRKFGTAVLIFPDGFKVDVATARMEYYESPGAPPVVETSSLKMDLYRRDFTINTLAIKLNKRDYGTLIDYFGAMKDIKEKVLRVLHNLSFVEDPTRMFRAVRFEQRFNFKIGKLTLALIKNAVKIDIPKDPANRRFFLELRLILKEKDPVRAIKRINEFDMLQYISPEIRFTKSVEHLLEEIRKVIDWYNLLYLEEPFEPWKVYWHGLTSSLSISSLKALAEKNGMVNIKSRRMITQRENMNEVLGKLYKISGDNYQIHTLLSPYDTESLLYMMARTNSEKAKRLISSYFTKLKSTKILLRGKDLTAAGFQPGPVFREIFDRLLEARLNDQLKTKEDELRFVEEHFTPYLHEK
jgi:tRNA nucleotidyltransferase (CCA-adding enzyme)